MNELQTKKLESAISEFKSLIQSAMRSVVEACKAYVKTIDEIPEAKEEFTHQFPSVSAACWIRYEMIGRGQILPEIAANPMKFSDRVIENFPLSDQKKLVENKVEVVTLSGDVIKTSYSDMTDEFKRIAFAKDHIRTLPEQKVFIETERVKSKNEVVIPDKTYKVSKNKLIVLSPSQFTKSDLLRILQEMEK